MRRVVIDTNCLFVDCAIAGQAEFLVSNDKHFAALKDVDFPAVNIIRLQEFVQQI